MQTLYILGWMKYVRSAAVTLQCFICLC